MITRFNLNMTTQEFTRLMGYHNAKRVANTHRPTLSGKRHTKGAARGVGQVLAHSFIKPQVSIERIYPYR